MDQFNFNQILMLIIALGYIIRSIYKVLTRKTPAPPQKQGRVGLPRQESEPFSQQRPSTQDPSHQGPAQQKPPSHEEAMRGGFGREVNEFLENIRNDYQKAATKADQKNLPDQQFGDPGAAQKQSTRPSTSPPPQQVQRQDQSREFGDFSTREARQGQRDEGWSDYEWEEIGAEPIEDYQRPPALPPRTSSPFPSQYASKKVALPPRGPTTAAPTSQSDISHMSETDAPRWLSLSEILSTDHSDTILGIPLKDAMALHVILGPPRAIQGWQSGMRAYR